MMRCLRLCALLALLASCATTNELGRSKSLLEAGFWEDAIAELELAAKTNEASHRYRAALADARTQAATQLLREGEGLRQAGRYDEARAVYERLLRILPAEQRATAGLLHIQTDKRHATLLDQAETAVRKGDLPAAEAPLKQVLAEAPRNTRALALQRRIEERRPRPALPAVLAASLKKPITLEFRDANLKMVFDVMSRASGINFILDKDIRPDARASIFVKTASIEDALESLLSTNQLAKKVLSDNSVLIYPNTPQKARDYQDLVIRNFFLSSADAKQMMNLLKTILKTRDVYVDEKRNLIVIRDTPEAVQLAERLITAHDQAEPEVMLEVEILEVGKTRSEQIGLRFPDQVGFGVVDPITLQNLRNLNSGGVNVTGLGSALTINLKKLFGDVNLLANPRIRVRNKEKAKIHVGDRVPVISSSVSTTTAISAQTVSYLDVGIKLEVEPQIFDDDVMIKVNLEVSALGAQVIVQNSIAYNVGTRNASTTLTLKDGETQILAGLISDNDRETANKLPGLSELPLLGRLFTNKSSDIEKREVILSITPRIVRKLERPDAWLVEYYSGPETNLRSAGAQPVPGQAGPRAAPAGARGAGGFSGQAPKPAAVAPGIPRPAGAPLPSGASQGVGPAAPGQAPAGAGQSTGTTAPAQAPVAPSIPFIFQPPPGVGTTN